MTARQGPRPEGAEGSGESSRPEEGRREAAPAAPARPSRPALPFDFAADRQADRASTGRPGRPPAPGRPRRRVFAGGRIRPPGVVRQEKAARLGRALGKALAWGAVATGIWAALQRERRRR